MGVHGLWPILQPCARPTPLPTLNRKRLAVDASIWIYQFLKAVRDKEGNALRNSHVVGFFRRICKLLFFGIKPVFVFDGGAPALKRQTIVGRKQRREGRRDDAVRTAGKLLAVQMKRRGEEEEEKRRREREKEREGYVTRRPEAEEEEDVVREGQDVVYVGELGMSAQERQTSRKFYKKDAYHLPELTNGIEGMGQPNDPRIMSAEELEEYARQFHAGEDVNLYDFSKIDFNGEFFQSLPAVDRYNILNAARLRSRLRMGLSKEQLEEMFPDRMEFSRFQIERVRERNELTQRLMNLNGMNEDDMFGVGTGRIASDRNREYVLVKNDGVEGGWALGVVSTDKTVGERNKPIDVEALNRPAKVEESEEEEMDFEDVPVEGLNRLPRLKGPQDDDDLWEDYSHLESTSGAGKPARGPADSLFVDEATPIGAPGIVDDEDEELNRAIALSMQKDPSPDLLPGETEEDAHVRQAIALSLNKTHRQPSEPEEDIDFEDVPIPQYQQRAVEAAKPIASTSGKMVAHIVNNRASAAVPKRKPAMAFAADSDSDSDVDMQAALARSKKQKAAARKGPAPVALNKKNPFDGPLPFESLPFKSSLFKKAEKRDIEEPDGGEAGDDMEGGFEKVVVEKEKPKPLPPWLASTGDIRDDVQEQQRQDRELNAEDRAQALEEERLMREQNAPIQIDSDEESDGDVQIVDAPEPARLSSVAGRDKSGDGARDVSNGQSPVEGITSSVAPSEQKPSAVGDVETMAEVAEDVRANPPVTEVPASRQPVGQASSPKDAGSDEELDWSESDHGGATTKAPPVDAAHPAGGVTDAILERSPSLEFEDVQVPEVQEATSIDNGVDYIPRRSESPLFADGDPVAQHPHNHSEALLPEDQNNDFDDFSDPEDEELLAQLAIEAEEHARFASTLNHKTEQENQAAYEAELRALRNQQKKDRRDADEVSHIMITECQALLRLFGLPYITAPMEAEAQCAELVNLGLVDGVVTDDCDIFLFGGTRVYKNMFNSNKFVECYLSSDIEKELSISRDQLIGLAHLLGSDYTEGLTGIGPVTALEILSEFPAPKTGLEEFKEWWTATQLNGQKPNMESTTFRKKFKRSQAAKLFLPAGFPSPAVTEAYLKPDVDSNPEAFQWGVPDLDQLREFLMATIGWTQERTDEVLVPVIRDMNQREKEGTQSNITRFFEGGVGVGANHAAAAAGAGRNVEKGSRRMKEAVGRLKANRKSGGGSVVGETFAEKAVEWAEREKVREEKKGKKSAGRKRGVSVAVPEENEHGEGDEGEAEAELNDDISDDEVTSGHDRTKKAPRRKRVRT